MKNQWSIWHLENVTALECTRAPYGEATCPSLWTRGTCKENLWNISPMRLTFWCSCLNLFHLSTQDPDQEYSTQFLERLLVHDTTTSLGQQFWADHMPIWCRTNNAHFIYTTMWSMNKYNLFIIPSTLFYSQTDLSVEALTL